MKYEHLFGLDPVHWIDVISQTLGEPSHVQRINDGPYMQQEIAMYLCPASNEADDSFSGTLVTVIRDMFAVKPSLKVGILVLKSGIEEANIELYSVREFDIHPISQEVTFGGICMENRRKTRIRVSRNGGLSVS